MFFYYFQPTKEKTTWDVLNRECTATHTDYTLFPGDLLFVSFCVAITAADPKL